VDDDGREVGDGVMGNLWVSGDSAFARYWNKPELTSCVKQGNWVSTGDKFIRDADGYYFYCGRADDMLKVSGMWVSPIEIENVLLGHPLVAEAAAVGCTDAYGLSQTVAFVVLQQGLVGSAELAKEIREHVRTRLAPYKCPRELRFCAELPKTATGKVQRFRLRDNALG
jgi:benzoate-CoA ligase